MLFTSVSKRVPEQNLSYENECDLRDDERTRKVIFTITAEIHARSLANFYCQYVYRHMNLKFMRRVSER